MQQQLFPDVVVTLGADVSEIQKRLLPKYLKNWRERCNHRQAQVNLLRELRQKNRVFFLNVYDQIYLKLRNQISHFVITGRKHCSEKG